MVDEDEGLIRLSHRQGFGTKIERRKTRMLQVKLLYLFFQALEEKMVIPIRDFQMSVDPFRHLRR